MIARRVVSCSVVAAAALGACFGDAQAPGQPSGATILVTATLPNDACVGGTYFGAVALGSGTSGFLTVQPYSPQQSCNGGGGGGGQAPATSASVFAFDRTTGALDKRGSAGMTSGDNGPRIAALGSDAVWAYAPDSASQSVIVDPGATTLTPGMSPAYPVAIAVGGTDTYVAVEIVQGMGGKALPNDPNFPCCGPTASQPGTIWKLGRSTPLASAQLACGTTDACLAASTTSVFYVAGSLNQAGPTEIDELPAGGGSGSAVATFAYPRAAVGMVASETALVWAESIQFDNQPFPAPACRISVMDLTTRQPRNLFDTSAFACMGLASDGTWAYFAIVSVTENGQTMRGEGIGRVALDGTAPFASLRLGLTGATAGPRRVFVDDTSLYLVDPQVIARIAKSALDGAHDFVP